MDPLFSHLFPLGHTFFYLSGQFGGIDMTIQPAVGVSCKKCHHYVGPVSTWLFWQLWLHGVPLAGNEHKDCLFSHFFPLGHTFFYLSGRFGGIDMTFEQLETILLCDPSRGRKSPDIYHYRPPYPSMSHRKKISTRTYLFLCVFVFVLGWSNCLQTLVKMTWLLD